MIPSRVGVLTLFSLLIVQAGALRPSPSPASQPTPKTQALPLARSQSLERTLASGKEHSYLIPLSARDFLSVEVDQLGIDTVVTLFDPAGQMVIRMDSPDGRRGKEPICAVASVSGVYLLKVSGKGTGWEGTYRVAVQDIRTATEAERACGTALRILAEGDALHESQSAQAAEKYRTALRTWTGVGDARGQVLALERLGDLLKNLNKYREALSSYDQALPLARSLKDRRAEARLSSHAGMTHFYLGDLVRARALSQSALDLAEAERYLEVQAYARNLLGMVLRGLGQVQDALASYRISENLWRTLNEPAEAARVLSNRGELYLTLGLHDFALVSFNRALELLRLEEKTDVRLWLLAGAALAQHELGDRRRAMMTYRRALGLVRNSREQAVILGRIAIVLRDEGHLARAVSVLQESLQLARRQGDRRREAYALADLAHIEDLRRREAEAVRIFNQALAIVTDLQERAVMASVLFGRAEAERDRGRFDEAIASINEAINLVEDLRSNLSPGQRLSFFAARHRYYELNIGLLMEKHRRFPAAAYQARAFEAGERSRARSLLDEMAGRPGATAMTLKEIQREVLDRDSLLMAYQLGEPSSILWVVTPDSLTSFDLPSGARIKDAVLQARQRLSAGAGWAGVENLSGMLLPAGIGPLGHKRLLIVPDGILHLVPFSALCNAAEGGCQKRIPLVLNHEVVHLPSASVLGRMRQKLASRPPAPGLISVLADPVFQRGDPRLVQRIGEPRTGEREPESGVGIERLSRLHRTREEAKAILGLFPAEAQFSAFDFAASRETAMSPALVRARILHFATHNLVTDHPDLSGLVLSRFDESGRPVDGFLSVQEISDLKLPAELVVLSACGTGLGREVRGEGVVGLTRAFLHAGAKRVVVSLWNVREGETAELMTRFYRRMRDGLPAAAALRSAQASMASEGRPPRSWAGFVLQGEPR